jgi:hypothetical protein
MLAALLAVALAVTACGGNDDDAGDAASPGATTTVAPRVEMFPVPSRLHVMGRVTYPQMPPVGGDHNQVWQNCGFYSQPVEPEFAVHSMEHGAVWIAYRPNLTRAEVDALRQLARGRAYVLVAPWRDDNLPAPIVASAWGVQLKVPSASSPALAQFVATYAGGPQAPEPGAPCTGALGNPE